MAKRKPKSRSRRAEFSLAGLFLHLDPTQSWFCRDGCVVTRGDRVELVMHHTVVASWRAGETAVRNAMLVQLAQDERIVLEDLAAAFGLSSEAVRLIRRKAEAEGVLAVMLPASRASTAIAPELQVRMEKLFARGKKVEEVFKALGGRVSRATVSKYRKRWLQKPAPASVEVPVLQRPLNLQASAEERGSERQASSEPPTMATAAPPTEGEPTLPPIVAPREQSEYRVTAPDDAPSPEERRGAGQRIAERAPQSRRGVQHAGSWLLISMVASLGLHEAAREKLGGTTERPLRIALDALIAALAIGEGCVEGVRRIATSSSRTLLLANMTPSATWLRRTLGQVAPRSAAFHESVASRLIRIERESAAKTARPSVFYVDNHTREYTGAHELSWHWKMQRERAVRGVTDYWIHDSGGRPIAPLTAYQQRSLVEFLPKCAKVLRDAVGAEARVLVAFDRGGAFAQAMVGLRDLPEGRVDFVTYERAPFPRYGRVYFERHGSKVQIRRGAENCEVLVLDERTNLGGGRGRVRRLSVLVPGDSQINLLTTSDEDPAWLISTQFGRWVQENSFKYGAERWGFDQLDGRQAIAYAKGTLITNPYRRNLERLRAQALTREGKLRCKLARLPRRSEKRIELRRMLAEAAAALCDVKEAIRLAPRHIEIEKTHLYGRLAHHKPDYKRLVDTVRVACAHAEAHLAMLLASHLPRVDEAKRVLQNLFKAPGTIRVLPTEICVRLDPVGNSAERHAMRAMLRELGAMKLIHPGDPMRRPLVISLKRADSPQEA